MSYVVHIVKPLHKLRLNNPDLTDQLLLLNSETEDNYKQVHLKHLKQDYITLAGHKTCEIFIRQAIKHGLTVAQVKRAAKCNGNVSYKAIALVCFTSFHLHEEYGVKYSL